MLISLITNLYCGVSGYGLRKFTGIDEAASVVYVADTARKGYLMWIHLNKKYFLIKIKTTYQFC